ncbi:hypothetical protein [Larkinella terrae]|uniref:Lipocalin/cytosolic fatty-acid binding domain-containing protein n=1 Tax=Larkinella terrae TaxID=2025311 RepID=A0A7K0ET91_9BACT|nr:hypothetical protein [Larkinella terrae]MRS64766.1 hypothetical protein [Larkinella terrae]
MDTLIQTLVGTWFICSTNFPMWLKGDKTNPTFTYTLLDKKGKTVLLDEVKYLKNNKIKTLTGFDYPDPADERAFVWRGQGLLSLVRSHWKVALLDSSGQWAVIWFSKTLFTPEGVDIISRSPTLPADQLARIQALMEKDSLLKKHRPSLKSL